MNNDYPQISLENWIQVGEGGNGITYENPANQDILLKVNKGYTAGLKNVKLEFDTSVAVAKLGITTPAMREMVMVGDEYGIISERI